MHCECGHLVADHNEPEYMCPDGSGFKLSTPDEVPPDPHPQRREKLDLMVQETCRWLNSFNGDYKFKPADTLAKETEVIAIHSQLDYEHWIFTWGTGDDGGPSLMTGTWWGEKLLGMTHCFDGNLSMIEVVDVYSD